MKAFIYTKNSARLRYDFIYTKSFLSIFVFEFLKYLSFLSFLSFLCILSTQRVSVAPTEAYFQNANDEVESTQYD